jgi:hypothetical protein
MFELSVILAGVFTLIIASIEPICEFKNKELSKKWKIIVFVVLLVSIMSSPILTIISHNEDKKGAIQTAYLSQDHPLPRIYQNDSMGIYIKVGGKNANTFIIGKNINHIAVSDKSSLFLKSNDRGEAFLNGIIRNENGLIKATLHDSKLINESGSDYDLNFDEDAYEIINRKGKVVLQISIDSIQNIQCYKIQYLLYVKRPNSNVGPWWEKCDDEGQTFTDKGIPELSITPLFKYPGYKYTGIRR